MTIIFLLVSIVLAFGLVSYLLFNLKLLADSSQWVRPPGIIIGNVEPVSQGGSQVHSTIPSKYLLLD